MDQISGPGLLRKAFHALILLLFCGGIEIMGAVLAPVEDFALKDDTELIYDKPGLERGRTPRPLPHAYVRL